MPNRVITMSESKLNYIQIDMRSIEKFDGSADNICIIRYFIFKLEHV